MNEHAYVLVIADFRMPELNGMELLRKMKESNKFVRTILMTAFGLDDKMFQEYGRREIIMVSSKANSFEGFT
jgi:DNA-binding NtrC family response regulator